MNCTLWPRESTRNYTEYYRKFIKYDFGGELGSYFFNFIQSVCSYWGNIVINIYANVQNSMNSKEKNDERGSSRTAHEIPRDYNLVWQEMTQRSKLWLFKESILRHYSSVLCNWFNVKQNMVWRRLRGEQEIFVKIGAPLFNV